MRWHSSNLWVSPPFYPTIIIFTDDSETSLWPTLIRKHYGCYLVLCSAGPVKWEWHLASSISPYYSLCSLVSTRRNITPNWCQKLQNHHLNKPWIFYIELPYKFIYDLWCLDTGTWKNPLLLKLFLLMAATLIIALYNKVQYVLKIIIVSSGVRC